FSSRRRHTRFSRDWSSDVCSSDLVGPQGLGKARPPAPAGLVAAGGARLGPQARFPHAGREPEQPLAAHHPRPILVEELPEALGGDRKSVVEGKWVDAVGGGQTEGR